MAYDATTNAVAETIQKLLRANPEKKNVAIKTRAEIAPLILASTLVVNAARNLQIDLSDSGMSFEVQFE